MFAQTIIIIYQSVLSSNSPITYFKLSHLVAYYEKAIVDFRSKAISFL